MFTKKLRKNQNKMFSFCTQNVLRIFKTLRCLPMAKHHFLERKADGDQWIQVLHNGRQTGGQWSLVAYGFLFFPKETIAVPATTI